MTTKDQPRHIRYRIHARSIRAGILVARGIQYEPGGWIDWDLFLRAYLRTKDAAEVQLGNDEREARQ